ncbi:MAG: hypothetical protein M3083_12985, partial [Actinomycetota bacterium]|nr:hypothetical protein [Actinomycetota bacterium]
GPARRFGSLEVILGTIVATSRQHDLAWEVLKFFAVDPGPERQLAVAGFNAMPAVRANADAFAQGTRQAVGVDPAVWVAGLPSSSAENGGWIPAFAEVHDLLTAALAQVAAGASAAVAMPQAQQQAQAKIDAWFKNNRLPH